MKQYRKTTLKLFLTLGMILGMMALPVLAADVKAVNYDVWIGGTQVTSDHLSGAGWSYDHPSKTLTLKDANISGTYPVKIEGVVTRACIYSYYNLNIVLEGNNTIADKNADIGIYSHDSTLTITGDGALDLNISGEDRDAIYSDENLYIQGGKINAAVSGEDAYAVDTNCNLYISGGELTASADGQRAYAINSTCTTNISGGTVKAEASGYGCTAVNAKTSANITGGTVTAKATGDKSRAVSGGWEVNIKGGDVTAASGGSESYGIYSWDPYVTQKVVIGEKAKLNATGDTAAICGDIVNLVSGTGWTNTAGTEGKIDIPVNTTGQSLSYKKIKFPADAAHNIKTKNVTYLQISSDKTTAYEGDIVTINAWTEGSYSPVIYVKKTSDNSIVEELSLTATKQGFKGTFKMPDYDVTVTGKVEGADDGGKVKIGSTYNVNGAKYTVSDANSVLLKKAPDKKSFTIPAKVKIKGKTFYVTGIKAKAFKGLKTKTVTIKTKKLTKSSVKNSFKGSKVRTVKVKVGKKKENREYVKKYRKIFTKKNAGRKVTVK